MKANSIVLNCEGKVGVWRKKNIAAILTGVAWGMVGGLVHAGYIIWAERFAFYKMYYLMAGIVVRQVNLWVCAGVAVFLISRMGSKLLESFDNSSPLISGKEIKCSEIAAFAVCSTTAIFLGAGYVLNTYFLPDLLTFQSLVGNGFFILAGIAFGFGWYKILKKLPFSRWNWKWSQPLLILAMVLFTGMNSAYAFIPRPDLGGKPNILFICIDALRAGHLSSYGYERETSPFLDQLAKEGVQFEKAYSQESYTNASVPSFFTSLYPVTHQVFYDKPGIDTLKRQYLTMAEILKNSGYLTAAFVFNPHLRERFGFSQGFDVYNDHDKGMDSSLPFVEAQETAKKIHKETIDFLKKNRDRRFFLYLHYRDVHSPYIPPPPYDKLYVRETRENPAEFAWRADYKPTDKNWMIDQYDSEIRYTDDQLRILFEELKAMNLLENTLVIINADHGEEFWEAHGDDPGFWSHGRTLYEEQIRIPMIYWGTSLPVKGRVVSQRVENLDILPTVLSLAGVKIPETLQGRSLLPLMLGDLPDEDPEVYSGGNHGRGIVIDGNWKYYRFNPELKMVHRKKSFVRPKNNDWRELEYTEELYDLSQDPLEQKNLAPQKPEWVAAYRKKLDAWFAKYGKYSLGHASQQKPDEATLEELKSLNYV